VEVVFPADPPPQSDRFEMLPEDESNVVASRGDLDALGLDTFPDGQLGILPTATPGVFDFYANQGDSFVDGARTGAGFGHTRGTLDDPVQQVVSVRGQMFDLLHPSDYVGGGAVYRDPASGTVIMLYHQETYLPVGFYSWLSAAVSHDGGVTFTDLGAVLTPNIPIDSELLDDIGGAGAIGDASLVAHGNYLYAYIGDVLATGQSTNTVARIAVPDLLAAAAAGTAPVFHKYYEGAFSQPGIAGLSSSIVPTSGNSVLWSACRQEFIMTGSMGAVGLTDSQSQLEAMTSSDGVDWSAPEAVYRPPLPEYRIYTTLVGDHVEPNGNRVVGGSEISVMTTSFDSSTDFWSNGELRRLTLVDHLAEDEGCVPAPVGRWAFGPLAGGTDLVNEVPGGAPLKLTKTGTPITIAGAVLPDDGAIRGRTDGPCCGIPIPAADPRFRLDGAFSVEWWEDSASTAYTLYYRSQNGSGGSGAAWDVQPWSGGRVRFYGPLAPGGFLTPPLPPATGWRHMAITSDGTTLRWYVAGVEVAAQAAAAPSGLPNVSGTLVLLRGSGGALDEVAVYDHALSAGAIAARVASPPDYPATVLAETPVAYWRFGDALKDSNGPIVDSSGNGFNGTYPPNRIPTPISGPVLPDGDALNLDGFNDGAVTASASTWNLTGDHTIRFRYRSPLDRSGTAITTDVVSKGSYCRGCGGWAILGFADGSLTYIRHGFQYRSAPGLVDGTWATITLTVDGTNVRWYRNGALVSTIPINALGLGPSTASGLSLGKPIYANDHLQSFDIDDLTIYDAVVAP
jgi:hypothetical protein